jgi:hypothetical protein
MLVFAPVSPEAWRRLAAGEPLADALVTAAVGPMNPDEEEEAEFEALIAASLIGLARDGLRLVVVADTAAAVDEATGEGTAPAVERRQVTAFFADDPADAALVAAGDVTVIGALPLMWYDASELGRPIEVPTTTGVVTL